MPPPEKRPRLEEEEPGNEDDDSDDDAVPEEVLKNMQSLVAAAREGDKSRVEELLMLGTPWTAADAEGCTAGEAALSGDHLEVYGALVSAGVRSQLLLAALGADAEDEEEGAEEHSAYLK